MRRSLRPSGAGMVIPATRLAPGLHSFDATRLGSMPPDLLLTDE